jgi:hypothetical protein
LGQRAVQAHDGRDGDARVVMISALMKHYGVGPLQGPPALRWAPGLADPGA